jgi:hypothetical protein
MASDPQSVHFELLVSRNTIREAQRRALKLFCGRGCRFTAKELWKASGVTDASLENAMRPVHDPNYRALKAEELASLDKFLGAAFTSVRLEPAGLGAFELMDGQPPLPSVLTADSAKPAETPREKVERLQRALFNAIEELTA